MGGVADTHRAQRGPPMRCLGLLGSLEVMELKVEASEEPGEGGSQGRRGGRRVPEGNTGPLMEVLLQHLQMWLLLLLLLQEGNASCGKELLQQVLHSPTSLLGGLLCLAVQQQQTHQEKNNHRAGEEGVSFCRVGSIWFHFASKPFSPVTRQVLQ